MKEKHLVEFGRSYWLERAIKESESRDIVDALLDAEALVEILKRRFEEVKTTLHRPTNLWGQAVAPHGQLERQKAYHNR